MPRPSIASLLDCLIEIWRPTVTQDAIGVEERTYTLIDTVDAFINQPREPIVLVSGGEVPTGGVRWYGLASIDVQVRDVCKIVSGPMVDRTFEVNEPPNVPMNHHTEVTCIEWNGDIALVTTVPPEVIPDPIVAMIPTNGLVHDWDPAASVEGGPLVDVVAGVNGILQADAGAAPPVKRAGRWFDYSTRKVNYKAMVEHHPEFTDIGVINILDVPNFAQVLFGHYNYPNTSPGFAANDAFRIGISTPDVYLVGQVKGWGAQFIPGTLAEIRAANGFSVFLARTYKNGKITFYINGVEVSNSNIQYEGTTFDTSVPHGYCFGRQADQAANGFVGAIGRVLRYSRAVTADEMAGIFLEYQEIYPELPAMGERVSVAQIQIVPDGLANDWDPTDQTDPTRMKDAVGGADAIAGPSALVREANPPMVKFPVGATDANYYLQTAVNAVAHHEDEWTIMGVVRIDASQAGYGPCFIADCNQDADAVQKTLDRITSAATDPTAFQMQSIVSPGNIATINVDEAPIYPRLLTIARVVKAQEMRVYIDGNLAATVQGGGYIRQGVKATKTVGFGRIPGLSSGYARDIAIGRAVHYTRALSAAEIAQNHLALRAKYPALSRIW